MNGLIFFITLLWLLNTALALRAAEFLSLGFWNEVQKALRLRDYLLVRIIPETKFEAKLKAFLLAEIRGGRLRIDDLATLESWFQNLQDQRPKLKNLRLSAMTHLCFVTLIPLCLRLVLSERLWLGGWRDIELVLTLFGFGSLAWMMLRQWPQIALGREEETFDFIRAFLGEREAGPWREAIVKLEREAWLTGLEATAERRSLLKGTLDAKSLVFDQRLRWAEDLLGPAELILSIFFGSTLLLRPILSHFGVI